MGIPGKHEFENGASQVIGGVNEDAGQTESDEALESKKDSTGDDSPKYFGVPMHKLFSVSPDAGGNRRTRRSTRIF